MYIWGLVLHPFSYDHLFSSVLRPLSQVAGSLYLSHGKPALEQVTGGGGDLRWIE